MAFPVGAGELVLDQQVGGLRIGNPQQRLGQAHQHDPFPARQLVFMQEGVEPALAEPLLAHRADQRARARRDAVQHVVRQLRLRQQRFGRGRLVGAQCRAQPPPQRPGGDRRFDEDHGSTPARLICAGQQPIRDRGRR